MAMNYLDEHRKVAAVGDPEIIQLKPPFSFFHFVEERFGKHYDAIRRLCSLARALNAKGLIVESIPSAGIISEEIEDIISRFPDYKCRSILRISFWGEQLSGDNGLSGCVSDDLLGYAILKCDQLLSGDDWHVFEAVFTASRHKQNYIPMSQAFRLTICSHPVEIKGVMFCQQNRLNKACAQVALRSLLSRLLPDGDISYREINRIAENFEPSFNWGDGLSIEQIQGVLAYFNLKYNDLNYSDRGKATRKKFPYQKFAYAGQESGGGALLGFKLAGKKDKHHIIPVFGHTFNKDTWVPDANFAYFKIGKHTQYVPSENWLSCMIAHDDNFGPNYSIPRFYTDGKFVDYVVEIFRPGVSTSGIEAEALALHILNSILRNNENINNEWIRRLNYWKKNKRVVLRALALKKMEYMNYLRRLTDWDDNKEDAETCDIIEQSLPEYAWVVEISAPQLFPANKRKLGEVVFDATLEPTENIICNDMFLFARLPGSYFLAGEVGNGAIQFRRVPSQILSHAELVQLN